MIAQRLATLAFFVLLGGCASAPEQRQPPPPAKDQAKPALQTAPPAMTTCASPVAAVIVIEAQPDGSGMSGLGGTHVDPYARLHIPPIAQIARRLADKSGCLGTLEADAALLAIPGGVQPDLVLRVRASVQRTLERSLVEKATGAAKRYVGRYTGDTETDPDALQAAEVSLEFVCPKQRRVIQVFKGSADGPLGEPPLTGERLDTVRGANHERVALAYAKAQDAALLYLHAKPRPCD